MKPNFVDNPDLMITSSSWEQYERMRLERLKEQRQRVTFFSFRWKS